MRKFILVLALLIIAQVLSTKLASRVRDSYKYNSYGSGKLYGKRWNRGNWGKNSYGIGYGKYGRNIGYGLGYGKYGKYSYNNRYGLGYGKYGYGKRYGKGYGKYSYGKGYRKGYKRYGYGKGYRKGYKRYGYY
jgi:hypothetical protein